MRRHRFLFFTLIVLLVLGGGCAYWFNSRLPCDPASVDRIEVVDALGERTYVTEDLQKIARILELAKWSNPFGVHCGGFTRGIQVRLFAGQEELGRFGVGDYNEWGYDGHVRGFSDELADLVREIVRRDPNGR